MPKPLTAPTIADIDALAQAALMAIPEPLRRYTDGIVIRVEEFPDEETQDAMDLESPFDLLGLYSGISLDLKSGADVPDDLDLIFLYRRPILDYWCETGEDLGHIVRHVLVHEIGHHFGFSDEAMHRLEEDDE